jgi:diaminopimelate decarboxylase
MDYFQYKNGEMYAEDLKLSEIADKVGTPFYCYSSATLERHYGVFKDAFADHHFKGQDLLICYALKANSNQAVISILAALGSGADVVSIGELKRALMAGIPAAKIVYSGVAKTVLEMTYALEQEIYQFNVESVPELYQLSELATSLGKTAHITFRINPDVDAKTHAKISTGKAENKFGVPLSKAREIYAEAAKLSGLKIVGVDLHIGSQLTDLEPFREAFSRIAILIEELRRDGHEISRLDLGGGLGIPYDVDEDQPPLPTSYAQMVRDTVGHLGCRIIIEPGRLLVGNAGILVSKVIYKKQGEERKFLIIDAAMNDLIRPSMYEAHHDIVPAVVGKNTAETYDIVGPICETGDTFAKGREMDRLEKDDLVVIRSAGAYGAVMSSTYNTRPLIPEVLVKGSEFAIIRARPTQEDIMALDILPHWFN